MRPLQTTGLQKQQASRLICESLEARHLQAVQRLAGRPNEQQLQQCRAFKRSFQLSQTAERPQEKAHDVEVLDDATMTPQIGESLHQSGDEGQQPVDAYDGFPEDEAPPPYPPIEHGDDLQAGESIVLLFCTSFRSSRLPKFKYIGKFTLTHNLSWQSATRTVQTNSPTQTNVFARLRPAYQVDAFFGSMQAFLLLTMHGPLQVREESISLRQALHSCI